MYDLSNGSVSRLPVTLSDPRFQGHGVIFRPIKFLFYDSNAKKAYTNDAIIIQKIHDQTNGGGGGCTIDPLKYATERFNFIALRTNFGVLTPKLSDNSLEGLAWNSFAKSVEL